MVEIQDTGGAKFTHVLFILDTQRSPLLNWLPSGTSTYYDLTNDN